MELNNSTHRGDVEWVDAFGEWNSYIRGLESGSRLAFENLDRALCPIILVVSWVFYSFGCVFL